MAAGTRANFRGSKGVRYEPLNIDLEEVGRSIQAIRKERSMMSESTILVYAMLHDSGLWTTRQDIEEKLNISAATITRSLGKLIKDGVAERVNLSPSPRYRIKALGEIEASVLERYDECAEIICGEA